MKLKISMNLIKQLLVLVPFALILTGGALQTLDKGLSTILKFSAFAFMLVYIVWYGKFNKTLLFATLLFTPFLIYGVLISYNFKAGLSDGLRYLFPIIILFYGYSIKDYFGIILKFIIAFVILNILFQFVNYINWIRGIDQWFYYRTSEGTIHFNRVAGILRGTGLVVFFGFFGFFNMISFFVIKRYYHGKYKVILLGITLFGLMSSFSYKTIGTFAVIIFAYYYKSFLKIATSVFILALIAFTTMPLRMNLFVENFYLRIGLYITGGKSARSESYRVMLNEIQNFNFFGRGVGVFGGPASIKYNSSFYQKVSFKWYDAEWLQLTTTDTYYPHLFVELGMIGALMYLLVLFTPLIKNKINGAILFVLLIYFCLFSDSLFSFSLNSPEFLMFSLVLVYPIYEYEKRRKGEIE